MSETTTTTEVVEQLSSAAVSTKSWQKWSISNLQGLLPFLPKVPVQRESIGLLQQLSSRTIKTECILTRRFLTASANLPAAPSTSQPSKTRVQTIGTGTFISSPAPEKRSERKNVAKSVFSVPFGNIALLTTLSSLCPEFLRRPHYNWQDGAFLTKLAVYSGLLVLVIEGSGCLLGLVTGSMPPGLVFMVGALFVMMVIACMTIGHDPNSQHHAILSLVPATSQRNFQRER